MIQHEALVCKYKLIHNQIYGGHGFRIERVETFSSKKLEDVLNFIKENHIPFHKFEGNIPTYVVEYSSDRVYIDLSEDNFNKFCK
ncbi:MAG: hypothetical protein ACRDD7_09150 [Peptostreptococcaceae bacterium]